MLSRMRRKSGGFTLIELMIVIAIIAILAAILVPNFIRARAQGQLTACKSNLKNIGTAFEMYSTDWAGKYPGSPGVPDINDLSPDYLKTIPTCPTLGTAGSYVANHDHNDQSYPDFYNVICVGGHESLDPEMPAGYPRYDGVRGLVERTSQD